LKTRKKDVIAREKGEDRAGNREGVLMAGRRRWRRIMIVC
jgi:hypothetical protein